MPDQPSPTPTSPPPAANSTSAPEEAQPFANGTETILSALRSNELLSGIMDGRDVSLVYLDRKTVHNYFAAEGSAGPAQEVRPTTPIRPQLRIGELVLNPLPQWEIDRAAAVYVPMASHEAAKKRLTEHGLVVLCGDAGSGKRTAAIRLLGELIEFDTGALYELNPDLRLTELKPDELPTNAALLLETPTGRGLEGVNTFQLSTLVQVLSPRARNNALCIITNQAPARFPVEYRHLLQPWSLSWPGDLAATQRNVVQRYVRYLTVYGPDFQTVIGPALDALAGMAALDKLLAQPHSPGSLADLAELLVPVLRGEEDLAQALIRFGARAQTEVEQWFAGEHTPDLEALMVAAAVFNGAPYTAIDEASRALDRRWQGDAVAEDKQDKPVRPTSVFAGRDPISRRLKAIHASTTAGTQRLHYGEVREDVVVLDDPAWQQAVLDVVWQYDHIRRPLLDWLFGYGTHPRHALRTRAAAAIGALACRDFSTIEAEVLRDWAASASADTRRSAAQVLGITIWDENHSGPSARLLHHWASQPDQPRRQWTAAAAYAGLAGPRYPAQTLADLKLVAANTHHYPSLMEPLFRALLGLYATARSLPDRRLSVLEELAGWIEIKPDQKLDRDASRAIRRMALLAFLAMLWPEREDQVWELLLADIGVPGRGQSLGVELLRGALNFRQPQDSVKDGLHPRKLALEGLHSLLLFVPRTSDPERKGQFENLLSALVEASRGDGDEIERLLYHAEQWEDARNEDAHLLAILCRA